MPKDKIVGFDDSIKIDWEPPEYVVRMPLKDQYMLHIRVPDEHEQYGGYALEETEPIVKIIDLRDSSDATEKFLKVVDDSVKIYPSTRNLWTLIDIIHTTINLNRR